MKKFKTLALVTITCSTLALSSPSYADWRGWAEVAGGFTAKFIGAGLVLTGAGAPAGVALMAIGTAAIADGAERTGN